MRAFLAAAFRPSPEAAVRAAQDALRGRAGGGFRWAAPGQAHLTLRFLGEVADALAPRLAEAVAREVAALPSFPVRTTGYGAFPTASRARVLWLGLEDPSGGLPALLEALDRALAPFALRWEERPFVAHLTLGRHRGGGSDVGAAFRAAGAPAVAEPRLEGVVLFRSDPRTAGSVHTPLARAPLAC